MPPSTGGRRILRSSPSLSSLASSLSSLSLYTTTTSKTQWGPGSLAGKAILAMGKATIRGAERVVIFKRMTTIQAHLPCWDERADGDTSFMDRVFDDLLELSRPELYPESVRIWAMELILIQIASSHTAYLIACLSNWLLDDLILLITELMSVKSSFLEPRLANVYRSSLPDGHHSLGPCIAFISELAAQNETTYEATILSKFLDLVLLSASRQDGDHDDCQPFLRAFDVLSAPPWELNDFWRINLEQYWAFEEPPSLADVVQHIDRTSPTTWLIVEAHFLRREAPNMLRLATPDKYPMNQGRSVADVNYPSLKDFSLTSAAPAFLMQEVLDTGATSSCALWHFFRCIVLGGDVHALMTEHLAHRSLRSKVSLFSRMIYYLLHNTRESRSAQMRILCGRIGGPRKLNSIITAFLFDLTESDPPSKYALIDAVIVLIIPLLTPEMKSWAVHEDLFRRSHFFPSLKLRPSYSKATLKLFGVIRNNLLASVIGEPGSRSSREIADVLEPIFNGLAAEHHD
ncbi:hypothetical protein C8F04DRAFT_1179379 [Mycena alexandri]|uniref:Uncharacterized protein n=1 Tax=Mycena alexandri TaxID=1745969 RepID=A0AAD6T3M7_9AGAR|nr:hypothetical protein C8F04DRAFT_1179379 [Mycena alexandri]